MFQLNEYPAGRILAGGLLMACMLLLSFSSAASALTLGVGWTGDGGGGEAEMPLVGRSGAATFRQPMDPRGNYDSLVRKAAENGVTIHPVVQAEYDNDAGLPSGSNRTDFLNKLNLLVQRYGYAGQFWEEPQNTSLPKKYITTWELWNEPNLNGIGAKEFGQFVRESAQTIQNASQAKAARSTDVLAGGLLVWGNKGANSESPVLFVGAQRYLQEAYPEFGSSPNVTGVAIHPYELEPASFFSSSYTRLEAFKFAVSGFHGQLAELAGGGPQKSLWITETGWPAEQQWGVGESEQANLLSQSVQYIKNNQAFLNVKDYLWYNFRDRTLTGSEWDNWCGLRAHDGHFRQAWTAFQQQAGVPQAVPPAPGVETQGASEVFSTQARVGGSVNPHGMSASYRFEYGTTTSYGSTIVGDAGSGEGSVGVSAMLTALQPGTTYHYRLVASNVAGTSYGADHQFTTQYEIILAEDDDLGGPHAVVQANGPINTFFRTKAGTLGNDYYVPGGGWKATTAAGAIAPGAAPHPMIQENGVVDVFWRTPTGGLGHAYKLPSNVDAVNLENLPGAVAGEPHGVVDKSGTMNVFWRTPTGELGHTFYLPGSGKGWQLENISTPVAGNPYGVVDSGGTINVFWRTPSGTLGHAYLLAGSGNGWQVETMSNLVAGNPHPVVDNSGTMNVFWRTPTAGLGHIYYIPGSGKGWQTENLSGSVAGEPRPTVQPTSGAINVFYRTATGKLGHTWYTGPTGWVTEALSGEKELVGDPFPVREPSGAMSVFSRTPTGALADNWWTGPTGWGRSILPGTLDVSNNIGVHAVAQPGVIDVFFRSPTGVFGHDWFNGVWYGTEQLGGEVAGSAPTATTSAATSVTSGGAQLQGTVNPEGQATTYYFEYGTTEAYGSKMPVSPASAGSGSEDVSVHREVAGLSQNTVYHYRLVATSPEGTVKGVDRTFQTETIANMLKNMSVTEPFDGTTESLTNFNQKWKAFAWAAAKGDDVPSGWRALGSTSGAPNGAYFSTSQGDSGAGLAAVATLNASPASEGRYFSLWLDAAGSETNRKGYELRFTYGVSETYAASLYKWVAGVATQLATQPNTSLPVGSSFALVDKGGTVSAWANTGGGFVQQLAASDATYFIGTAGVEGTGNLVRLNNFKVGGL
jgi:hypothetical protein